MKTAQKKDKRNLGVQIKKHMRNLLMEIWSAGKKTLC